MNCEDFDPATIILTGKRLYDQVSRCYEKSAKFILAENPQTLLLISKDNLGATLFLDLTLFNDDVAHPMLRNILKKGFEQRIVVMTNEQDPAKLYPLMKQGVRGFCGPMISDELLVRAIQAVNDGELWIGRQFICYLISKLMLDQSGKSLDEKNISLNRASLTPREAEIAQHVAHGKCDKLIARDLNISPNTVKNHLGNIFKKLQISDRLHLALIYQGVISH
ncbi:MAG: response regulator transcription factor [Methylomicrobium sp.]